jgi:hypothetical protein
VHGVISQAVAACARRPWLVIVIAAALAAGALSYTAGHIAIDTDSTKLIAADVAWRQREMAFDAAFPQRVDLIAVVVDGATPELAEQATAALALRLSGQRAFFRAVWRPDGGPFFDRAGLLFESPAELAETTQRLIAAQPLLGSLAADPSLRGLMNALALMSEGVQHDRAGFEELATPLSKLADAFERIGRSGTGLLVARAHQRTRPRSARAATIHSRAAGTRLQRAAARRARQHGHSAERP